VENKGTGFSLESGSSCQISSGGFPMSQALVHRVVLVDVAFRDDIPIGTSPPFSAHIYQAALRLLDHHLKNVRPDGQRNLVLRIISRQLTPPDRNRSRHRMEQARDRCPESSKAQYQGRRSQREQPFHATAIAMTVKGETEYISPTASCAFSSIPPFLFCLEFLLPSQKTMYVLVRAGIGKDGNRGHNHGEDWVWTPWRRQ